MEPILKYTGKSKGLEVLYFEDAELQRLKGGQPLFAAAGHLSVLYFKDYNRFFLRLNDWLYPLMRRMPFMGMDKEAVNSRSYSFPGPNGSIYRLTINSCGSEQGLENFESILQESSKFSWRGLAHTGKLEQSPDDKLARNLQKNTSVRERISENFKQGLHSLRSKIETLKSGTKNINSRKKMMDLKSIKTKNFRKNAKSSFKKDFFENGEKLSQEFLSLRRGNLNMTLPKSFKDLISDSQLPSLYLWKEELEEAILNYRDISSKGNFNLEQLSEQKSNLTDSIKEGMKEFKDTLSGNAGRRENLMQDRSRNLNPNPIPGHSNISQIPSYEHYQG